MKKILIVSDQPTHPVIGGNRSCIMQYVEVLKQLGYDPWFLFIDNHVALKEDKDETSRYWGHRFLYYETSRFQELVRKIDKCCVHRSANSEGVDFYFPWGLNRFVNKQNKKINFHGMIVNYIWLSKLAFCDISVKALFTHDVFTYRNEKETGGYCWMSFSEREEAKAIRRFDDILSIQDNESVYYSYLAPRKRIHTVYSSFEFVDQPLTRNKNILFFSGSGAINIRAIKRFINEVMPLIIDKDPEIRLLIGGGICFVLKEEKLPPYVELKGRFENPNDFYLLGDVAVNPVSEGTGLKIKTMEAIAYGKYTVVSPHSAEGVFRSQDIPVRIATTNIDFRDQILAGFEKVDMIIEVKKECFDYIKSLNSHIACQFSEIFGNKAERV